MHIVPYNGTELVNTKAGLLLVVYDGRCGWCKGRLTGTALQSQVPAFCCPTHKRRYRIHGRPSTQPQPRDILQRRIACRRCGTFPWTRNLLRSQMCSVICILKNADPERYSSCWRKIPHWSQAAAIRAAWKLAQSTGDHGTHPYHCESCNHWHIGHVARSPIPDTTAG